MSRRGGDPCGPLSLTLFWDTQREVHPSLVVASDLAPTRAPHHPAPPRATTFRETTPPPGNGAVDTRAGWWARRDVVARGEVGGGWALVGARRRANRNMSGREPPFLRLEARRLLRWT